MTEAPRTVAFVVTEDWFFASHFLPMARAAVAAGHSAVVIARVRDHRGAIEATGARVVPFEADRGSLNPWTLGDAAGRLAGVLKALKPDLVQAIALKGILVGGAAAAMAGVPRRVHAVTGLGYLGARDDAFGRLARAGLKALVRGPLATSRTRYLFENPDDAAAFGLAGDPRATILGGAGVDPAAFSPAPMPPIPPLKVGLVARMLWSKGVDLAVEAVRLARARGAAVELVLHGAPDPANPRAIPEARLAAMTGEGVAWLGPTADPARFWAGRHVCCLPSRGGEGLPRTLLEGAACGRALLTTNVPGCQALVRDGIEGLVVPPDDAGALAEALMRLAADPDLVARLGAAARRRIVEDGFTEDAVAAAVARVHAALLAG